MSRDLFNPADLESIKDLCADKVIPLSWRTVRELCRQKKFPAVRQGRAWMTTRDAIRSHFYKGANPAFRRLAA